MASPLLPFLVLLPVCAFSQFVFSPSAIQPHNLASFHQLSSWPLTVSPFPPFFLAGSDQSIFFQQLQQLINQSVPTPSRQQEEQEETPQERSVDADSQAPEYFPYSSCVKHGLEAPERPFFNWTYYVKQTNPDNWCSVHPAYRDCCMRQFQSPIEIETNEVAPRETTGRSGCSSWLRFQYPEVFHTFSVVNNGRSVMFELLEDVDNSPAVYGQCDAFGTSKRSKYVLRQLHFHWGSKNWRGSEHVIDGRRAPMEMHLVHQEADNEEQEMVIAVLFNVSPTPNRGMKDVTRAVRQVQNATMHPRVHQQLRVRDLLPKQIFNPYGPGTTFYCYLGSLTSPPCTCGIRWFILKNPVSVTEVQLEAFRQLRTELLDVYGVRTSMTLSDNFRPLQPANSRSVCSGTTTPDPLYRHFGNTFHDNS